MIEFLCPQGHKIHCPDDQAGRAAKCPRCGAKFRVPGSSIASSDTPLGPAAGYTAELTDSSPGSSPTVGGKPRTEKESQIEFLCPNGHHLHGPASLQGRPGECPECGSRFRIPILDELDVNAEEEPINLDGGGASGSAPSVSPSENVPAAVQSSAAVPSGSELSPGPVAAGGPGIAELFGLLWASKGKASRVEVHLESGGVLVPDGFAKNLSNQGLAVLVTKDPDGTFTVNAVPWSTVSRVIVRGLGEVPGEILW